MNPVYGIEWKKKQQRLYTYRYYSLCKWCRFFFYHSCSTNVDLKKYGCIIIGSFALYKENILLVSLLQVTEAVVKKLLMSLFLFGAMISVLIMITQKKFERNLKY